MNELLQLLKEKQHLGYHDIHGDQAIQKMVYAHIHITCEQSPFDYIDTLYLQKDGAVYGRLFIEPVGTIGFEAENLSSFFQGVNTFFNSQPADITYAVAGHKIAHYQRHIRKSFAIDFRYLDVDALWSIDFEEKELPLITAREIVTGKDLFSYVRQKNRLVIGVLDGVFFHEQSLEDGMLGEILTVEEVFPDFFKILVDLTLFEEHNQWVAKKSGHTLYPHNRLAEVYIAYEENIQEFAVFELLKQEDVAMFQQQAKKYWENEAPCDFSHFRTH